MLNAKNKDYFERAGHMTVFSLRLDDEVYRLLKLVAENEGRSINAQLTKFIEGSLIEYLEEHKD